MRLGTIVGKGKRKVHSRTGHEGPEGGQNCDSTLSLTSAPDGVGDQRHDPSDLRQGTNKYPLYRRQSGAQGRSGRYGKSRPPAGFHPRTF